MHVSNMGWLRWVGSIKVYVSFAKEPYKRDYILQKRPIILSRLLIVATPYVLQNTILYNTCSYVQITYDLYIWYVLCNIYILMHMQHVHIHLHLHMCVYMHIYVYMHLPTRYIFWNTRNMLQGPPFRISVRWSADGFGTTHCNSLQHTAIHCNTLQCTATHCNTLQRLTTPRNALYH